MKRIWDLMTRTLCAAFESWFSRQLELYHLLVDDLLLSSYNHSSCSLNYHRSALVRADVSHFHQGKHLAGYTWKRKELLKTNFLNLFLCWSDSNLGIVIDITVSYIWENFSNFPTSLIVCRCVGWDLTN